MNAEQVRMLANEKKISLEKAKKIITIRELKSDCYNSGDIEDLKTVVMQLIEIIDNEL